MSGPQSTDEVAELLAAMIAVPSVNPRGRSLPDRGTGERAMAEFVRNRLAPRGIEVRLDEFAPGRVNAIAVVPGRTGRTVVLEAHTDTVEVDGMTVDPFAATVRDGRMYGRGACDAKGSLAAYLLALEQVALESLPITVVLAAVADEEHRYRGVSAFLETYGPGDVDYLGAIVGEPTELAVGIAHKGVVRFTVHVEGRSGHSSRPADALNAVTLATDLVRRIADEPGAQSRHTLLGGTTRTVVRIAGGEGPNVVPGHCEFDVDRRTLPGEDPLKVWSEVADELSRMHPGKVRVDEPFVVDYALDTPADRDVVKAMQRALTTRELPSTPVGLGYCSDASKFSRLSIPALVFGPGSIADAHTADESVALADVATARDVVLDALRALAGVA
jgi:acetylornithine deacetylase/succinyl-diaminopimelate desuccinylase-like protein